MISLLQCLPYDSILSIVIIYESLQHCQSQECHKMFIEKRGGCQQTGREILIFQKENMKIQKRKWKGDMMIKRIKRRWLKESVKQYKKEKCEQNWTSNIAYKKEKQSIKKILKWDTVICKMQIPRQSRE